MNKIPIKSDCNLDTHAVSLEVKSGDIVWDDLFFGDFKESIKPDDMFGCYYIILDVINEDFDGFGHTYIKFDRYTKEMEYIGPYSLPIVLWESKSKNRLFLVEFESVDEEAKFRLMI